MSETSSHQENGRDNGARISPLARFFFIRPVFAILLTFMLVISGLMAYQSIVKEAAPDLTIPQATVQTEWPGADPETIEKQVTNKIEKKIKSMKGLKRVRSASFNSFSVIAVEFRPNANLTESMQILREKVRDAEPDLPSQAKKPKIEQVSVDDTPMLTIALFGEVDSVILGNTAKYLKDRLEKVPGVKKVDLGGRRKEVVQIQLDPARIVSLGISPTTVRDRIRTANLDMPWDKIENDEIGATVRLYGRFRDVKDLGELPVARLSGGRAVRLNEIGDVHRDLEREKSRVAVSWAGSKFERSVDMSVMKVPGVDTIKTIDRIKGVLEEEFEGFAVPYGIKYSITSDQSEFISEKLRDVFNNGWQAMLCVFVVLFFLLSWREALVAGLSIPVTFLGALSLVSLLGHSLNEMVIIGMVIALGLLVDVFILMMEGMHEGIFGRHLPFGQAAVKTVKTYALPAFTGQMTTILAMVPLFGIGGIDGKFIRIIPVTAICCLVLSFIIALFVDIPLSRAVFSKVKKVHKKSRIDRLTKVASEGLCAWSLRTTVRNRWTALLCTGITVVLLILSVMGMGLLPSILYPKADGRNLGITVELAPGTTLAISQKVGDDLGEILRSKPYLKSVVKFVGQKSPLSRNSIAEALMPFKNSSYVGFSCIFTALEDREKMAFHYLDDLRDELSRALRPYPGSAMVFTPQTGGSTTEDPIQVQLVGDDMEDLRRISLQVQAALREIPGTSDVRDNLGPSRLDVKLLPNREALDFYQIDQDDLACQIRFAMTDDEIGKFPLGGTEEDLEIRLGMAWPSRHGLPGGPTRMEEIGLIRPFRPNGQTVSIFSVLNPVVGEAPLSITHQGGRRSVTVLSKTDKRTVDEILSDLESGLKRMKADWPAGYNYRFGGEAESAAETYSSAGKMFFVAIFLVFALLALQFGSFSQPFIIMFSLPFAMIGTFGGFFLAWIPFSFPAMIGIISLVGIVVNDAIVMIGTMNKHRHQGLSVREAAARGAADRLRPIVSTTITTVVGLIPLSLSSPMWMPLCNAIIFGLISATFISQLVVPCLYLLMTPDRPLSTMEIDKDLTIS
ncbi:MAG: efflux RND transporter permease subunit [Thermodesulfobacteriota bacterium]|nr:efflux RND transporter permease subunit [Thermodesulfobacteriota bacterium]